MDSDNWLATIFRKKSGSLENCIYLWGTWSIKTVPNPDFFEIVPETEESTYLSYGSNVAGFLREFEDSTNTDDLTIIDDTNGLIWYYMLPIDKNAPIQVAQITLENNTNNVNFTIEYGVNTYSEYQIHELTIENGVIKPFSE